MPIRLKPVDLSGAAAGSIGILDLSVVQASAEPGHLAHIQLFNESGCGLFLTFSLTPGEHFLPAGGWQTYTLSPGEVKLTWYVEYVLQGANVTQLFGVWYDSHEAVPSVPIVGNSPATVGGTVNTSTAQVIVNDGNVPGTEFVEATPSGAGASYVSIKNDGSVGVKALSVAVTQQQLLITPGGASNPSTVKVSNATDNGATVYGSLVGNADSATLAADSSKLGGELPGAFAHKAQYSNTEGTALTGATAGYTTVISFDMTFTEPVVCVMSGAFSIAAQATRTYVRLIVDVSGLRTGIESDFTDSVYTTWLSNSKSRKFGTPGTYTFSLIIWLDTGASVSFNKTTNYPYTTYLTVQAVPCS